MPPKLIPRIKTSPHTFTIGIVGSRRISEQLRKQVDAAVFATIIAQEGKIQFVVDASNRFGKHMLRRAERLRKSFPNLIVIALAAPMAYKNYFTACERGAINNTTSLFSCADEIMLFKGRFPLGTSIEQHQIMAEACNIILDGYASQDARFSEDLVRAMIGKSVKHEMLSDFSDREMRYLNSVCRKVGLPDIGRMGDDHTPEP